VGVFGFVELEGAADAVEDGLAHAGGVAAFEAGVVLHADPRDQRDLFPAQASDAAAAAEVGQTGLLRGEPSTPRDQELTHLVGTVHAIERRRLRRV